MVGVSAPVRRLSGDAIVSEAIGGGLSPAYKDLLETVMRAGTPEETRRAIASDLRYITAWKLVALGSDLVFPEPEAVVAQFVLDHSVDIDLLDAAAAPRVTAEALIRLEVRRIRSMPRSSTVDRRLASWRRIHVLKGCKGPFESPALREIIRRARGAARSRHGAQAKKSKNPVTQEILDQLIAHRGPGVYGLRDAALLETAWASGGRRRSEMASLEVRDLDRRRFARDGVIMINLRQDKSHQTTPPPPLILRGRAARTLDMWLRVSGLKSGLVFRALTRPDKLGWARIKDEGVSGRAIARIFKRALRRAGLPQDYASPHGIRSGFITDAARAGISIEAVMRVTLHSSRDQVAAYYHEVDLDLNDATRLRRDE